MRRAHRQHSARNGGHAALCRPYDSSRYCERSEAIHFSRRAERWIASSLSLLAMTKNTFHAILKQQMRFRVLAARQRPSFAQFLSLPNGGSRECRVRAAPAVSITNRISPAGSTTCLFGENFALPLVLPFAPTYRPGRQQGRLRLHLVSLRSGRESRDLPCRHRH